MDQSIAGLDDAAKQVEEVTAAATNNGSTVTAQATDDAPADRNKKRKFDSRNGSDAKRGRGRDRNGRGNKRQKQDMGRAEYFASNQDKREKIDAAKQERRDNPDAPRYGVQYTEDEIQAQERRPKKKVAVFIGYAGTGYKGMQITPLERTIEGDLFTAFVKAGAISKANADDPRKASLVRCARTDKGVHAAGNMISLKLITEDEDIVQKINAELPEQIRVWGIERTVGSFSCYQAVDSRWYEYLIPSYAFLPPHPSSYLAKQLELALEETGDREAYDARQADVKDFWNEADAQYIEPIIASLDADIRDQIREALFGEDEAEAKAANTAAATAEASAKGGDDDEIEADAEVVVPEESVAQPTGDRTQRIRAATKRLREAYTLSKRRYRISQSRIEAVQLALDKYVGTKTYHNYTVNKDYKDPSAKRNILSFVVNPQPVLIGDGEDADKAEWLSMKVHGQSFMMHQIRKMVSLATMLVRCGSDLSTMDHTFTPARYSIPKVPGLGLMLERPVFDSYNKFTAAKHERDPLLFDKYDKEIEEFKHKQIYTRMFEEEEKKAEFARFFNHIDNFPDTCFLYVTSKGHAATVRSRKVAKVEQKTPVVKPQPEISTEEVNSSGEMPAQAPTA